MKTDATISLDSYAKLREYIANQLDEADAEIPNSADLISISPTSSTRSLSPDFEIFTPRSWMSSDFSNAGTPQSRLSFSTDPLGSPMRLHNGDLSPRYVSARELPIPRFLELFPEQ